MFRMEPANVTARKYPITTSYSTCVGLQDRPDSTSMTITIIVALTEH
jgi:hypothetical protein